MVVDEGHIIIIAPNVLHRTTDAHRSEYERLVVNIHNEELAWAEGICSDLILSLLDHEYLILKCPPQTELLIKELSRSVIKEIRERNHGFELYARTLVFQMLILSTRQMLNSSVDSTEVQNPAAYERIFEAVRYMNDRYMDDLSLPLVAEKFYISPYYLSRFFKEATGFTFIEYLNHVRVKEAKQLLENSSMKVNLIAKKVGFGSITHFGRVFKQVTGQAPLYYRKRG